MTLTLDRVIRHTVVFHLSTSTYIPNFIGIGKTFCGWTDVRTYGHVRSGSVTASVSPAPPIPGFSPTSVAECSLFAYADDTQLYVAMSPTSYSNDVNSLQQCLASLNTWFCENGMALNPSKSVATIFGTSQRVKSIPGSIPLNVAGTAIPLSDSQNSWSHTQF